ncbi:hypothetical protein LQE92_04510 [Lacrimispora sp. NSJ-141]|uniref:Uncharacterized protein n=1 Tax=Lientehia hominis TaxID=2897778 RepID=A0AAP2RJ84_9FIRM|nr:hypothetical protein [Lientehia hominis]MCD2491888.1 hypothetical protein [Lientehia hominis]
MEKYRFIHVSWKGPAGGRKDSGYGCQRAALMEADFLLPYKSDQENLFERSLKVCIQKSENA